MDWIAIIVLKIFLAYCSDQANADAVRNELDNDWEFVEEREVRK